MFAYFFAQYRVFFEQFPKSLFPLADHLLGPLNQHVLLFFEFKPLLFFLFDLIMGEFKAIYACPGRFASPMYGAWPSHGNTQPHDPFPDNLEHLVEVLDPAVGRIPHDLDKKVIEVSRQPFHFSDLQKYGIVLADFGVEEGQLVQVVLLQPVDVEAQIPQLPTVVPLPDLRYQRLDCRPVVVGLGRRVSQGRRRLDRLKVRVGLPVWQRRLPELHL